MAPETCRDVPMEGDMLLFLGDFAGREGFDAVQTWLLDLRRRLGIPETLSAIGIEADGPEEIGRLAENDPSTPTNALPVTAADLSAIFRRAVTGDIS